MNPDDRRLITECLNGRPDAFGDLVLRYQDRLYNAVVRVVGHADDAADVVQDAFLNAYLSLNSFKGDSELFTWMYRIAFNAAVSQKRKKKPAVSLDTGSNGERTAEPADETFDSGPGDAIERAESESRLAAAVSRLSSEHRAVIVLKDIDGMKYEQIAEVTGLPIGTVRSRLHRARLELRDLLTEQVLPIVESVGQGPPHRG